MVDFYKVLGQHTAGGTARKRPVGLELRHARMRLIRCFQLTKSAATAGPRIFPVLSIDGCQGFNLPHRPRLSALYSSRTKLSKKIDEKEKSENRVTPKSMSPLKTVTLLRTHTKKYSHTDTKREEFRNQHVADLDIFQRLVTYFIVRNTFAHMNRSKISMEVRSPVFTTS